MDRIKYENRCRCNEEISSTKKRSLNYISEGKSLPYPDFAEVKSKTFQIKYEHKLSSVAKFILNSFQNKYLYYAIDDILYSLKTNSNEQHNLLETICSPIISLQNNELINFFDIWIQEISINEVSKVNKFIENDSKMIEQFSLIKIKLFYKNRVPLKKQKSLW